METVKKKFSLSFSGINSATTAVRKDKNPDQIVLSPSFTLLETKKSEGQLNDFPLENTQVNIGHCNGGLIIL